jgi:pimeloyl-ACP methyl ester carboxylesterase
VGDRLVEVLPQARLVVLDGGHYLPVDAPGPLADAIEEFLRG